MRAGFSVRIPVFITGTGFEVFVMKITICFILTVRGIDLFISFCNVLLTLNLSILLINLFKEQPYHKRDSLIVFPLFYSRSILDNLTV